MQFKGSNLKPKSGNYFPLKISEIKEILKANFDLEKISRIESVSLRIDNDLDPHNQRISYYSPHYKEIGIYATTEQISPSVFENCLGEHIKYLNIHINDMESLRTDPGKFIMSYWNQKEKILQICLREIKLQTQKYRQAQKFSGSFSSKISSSRTQLLRKIKIP